MATASVLEERLFFVVLGVSANHVGDLDERALLEFHCQIITLCASVPARSVGLEVNSGGSQSTSQECGLFSTNSLPKGFVTLPSYCFKKMFPFTRGLSQQVPG
jgi:hypothetical protein